MVARVTRGSFYGMCSVPSKVGGVCTCKSLKGNPNRFLRPVVACTRRGAFNLGSVGARALTMVSLGSDGSNIIIGRLSEGEMPCGHGGNRLGPTSCGFIGLSSGRFISLLYKGSKDFFSLLSDGLRPLREFKGSPVRKRLSVRSSQVGLGKYLSTCRNGVMFAPGGLPCLTGCRLRGSIVVGS